MEGFHDGAFEQPADKLREVTAKVRALLAGERAQLDNTAARPLRLGLPPVPELPIWLAAMGERTTRVAAELGDGWIPVFVSPDRLPRRAAELGRARRAADLRSGRPILRRARGRRVVPPVAWVSRTTGVSLDGHQPVTDPWPSRPR